MNTTTLPQKHVLSEIKRQRTKLFNPVSTMQRMNRKLAELITLDPSDGMYNYLLGVYLQTLDLYHVDGRSGSLLPQAKAVKQ